jgi:hypothetical protein
MGDTDNRRVTTTIGRLKNPLLPDIFYPIFFIRYFLSDRYAVLYENTIINHN